MSARRLRGLSAVFRREFAAYFATPIAFVFLVIFLMSMGVFTFYVGHFYDTGTADLTIFFSYHPWLYLFLLPALAMRLWAEERRSGSIELLLTLPLPVWASVLGKYLAAWAFAGLALALTFPIWLTVNYLGHPDNGVILASYCGSFLMAGAYLAIGAAISAATSNQVIAFVVAVVVCFLFTAAGAPLVMESFSGWAPLPLVEAIASFSFLSHFNAITDGVIDLRDIVFFASLIGLCLFANILIVETGKGG
jgi:ABC-2 type transport system permease protein